MIKQLPYITVYDSPTVREGAAWLKNKIKPLLTKRLPTIYYAGFKHGFIPAYISRHKKQYPFFVSLDIQKFYPSLNHQQLTVQAQLAYKQLLGVRSVPKSFSNELLYYARLFFKSIPTLGCGIPLNSAFGKALAPLIYTRLFLKLKSNPNLVFIVYCDDILILATSNNVAQSAWAAIVNYLTDVKLTINLAKVQHGRFANGVLDYCGYRFAGGYVSITSTKSIAFNNNIKKLSHSKRILEPRAFIKIINSKINGFGHYYKYGNVANIFAKADAFVRQQVRVWYGSNGLKKPSSATLTLLGLRSLVDIKKQISTTIAQLHTFATHTKPPKLATSACNTTQIYLAMDKLQNQNTEIIAQLKMLNHNVKQLLI